MYTQQPGVLGGDADMRESASLISRIAYEEALIAVGGQYYMCCVIQTPLLYYLLVCFSKIAHTYRPAPIYATPSPMPPTHMPCSSPFYDIPSLYVPRSDLSVDSTAFVVTLPLSSKAATRAAALAWEAAFLQVGWEGGHLIVTHNLFVVVSRVASEGWVLACQVIVVHAI